MSREERYNDYSGYSDMDIHYRDQRDQRDLRDLREQPRIQHRNSYPSTSNIQLFPDLLPPPGPQSFHPNSIPPQSQHISSNMNPMHSQNQWQQSMMPPRQPSAHRQSQHHHQLQQPQQQQPQSMNQWHNQMQPPASTNGMSGFQNMGFNMPFMPAFQGALMMSMPVGSAHDDDLHLVKALHECTKNNLTYRQALESLHGVNNHSATLWKDYYLDNKPRLDALVIQYANGSIKSTKKPGYSSGSGRSTPALPPAPSGSISISKASQKPTHTQKSTRQSSTSASAEPSSRKAKQPLGRRQTINSLTAYPPTYSEDLPPPNADIKPPPTPSRSPTPPSIVVPATKGNRYTPEDKAFFIKFIAWRLKQNPNMSRTELCKALAEKAPHHSQDSWASHWSSNHDVADKIFAAAAGGSSSESESSSEEEDDDEPRVRSRAKQKQKQQPKRGRQQTNIRAKPNYVDPDSESDSEADASGEDDDEESGSEYVHNDADDDDDDTHRPSDDEKNMGESRSAYTDADFRVTARFIATVPDWKTIPRQAEWQRFSEMHPQRSWKSWQEFYRRYEARLDRMVKQYKRPRVKRPDIKVENPSASISSQRGRPSWASPTNTNNNGSQSMEREHEHASKRKADDSQEQAIGESSHGVKRSRGPENGTGGM